MWTHLCGASFPLCLTERALIDTEKTRRDPKKTLEDPKRPEKTQKDQRRPKKIQKEFYCLFICHKQIDNNTPLKQIKEMSVSVSVSSFFLIISTRDRHYFWSYRSGDDDHDEDDKKRESKWLQNAHKTIIMPSFMPIEEYLQELSPKVRALLN